MSDIFAFMNDQIFGGSLPKNDEDIQAIIAKGIDVVISFEAPSISIEDANIEHIPLFIKDFGIPSEEQVKKFLSIVKERLSQNKKILVHCYAGCGRTGLMLVLISLELFHKDLKSTLQQLLEVRPCSTEVIHNPIQSRFLKEYAERLKQRASL
ncbi:MAG: protein-tyrosine phosphatase family protein [Promethearchaeota archaeon]